MSKKRRIIGNLVRIFVLISGSIFIVLCVLALTTLPFRAYYSLATTGSRIENSPEIIVMLAGAGIPSENGLIRAYFTARLAAEYPDAQVIIAVPGILSDSLGDPRRIAAELAMRGLKQQQMLFANTGKNTRGQALEISNLLSPDKLTRPITIVTSPEHIKRAVLCFRKCGFTDVSGFPAFETSLETNLSFDDHDLKGNKMVPPIGSNLQIRYQFWNHLKYEVIVVREYLAIVYYKLRGWV
ncbi:MAG: YdcF family protein [Bacteroidales bacterium]|nr:YdcF family protein [Bacteroidales bacterium]